MIEFENVSFSYTGQEHGGLHDINLKISDGECVLFCGRSGCGKTTITRLVNGLIPQFYQGELHGRVLVDGQEISNIPMYQIAAKVGSVFQNPRTQFFNVDTDSEIAFGIENEARPPKKLAERVEQTTEDLRIQKLRSSSCPVKGSAVPFHAASRSGPVPCIAAMPRSVSPGKTVWIIALTSCQHMRSILIRLYGHKNIPQGNPRRGMSLSKKDFCQALKRDPFHWALV